MKKIQTWRDDFQLTLYIQDEVNITRKTGNIFLTNIHRVYSGNDVEAISQNVVKHPVLPDSASRAKLSERKSSQYTEKYADYLHLGMEEWRKTYKEHAKLDKKAILFVMTDDTKNCDDVAQYLEATYPELKDAVLVIHTKNKVGM